MSRVDAAAVVAALRGVPGVASAAVQPLPGEPVLAGNLRVVLRLGADPDDVADAVLDLLDARFGLGIDGLPDRPAPAPGRPRLRLVRALPPDPPPFRPQPGEAVVGPAGPDGVRASVALVAGARRAVGTVRAARDCDEASRRAVAEAAARALADLRGEPIAAQVRDLVVRDGHRVEVELTGESADGSARRGTAVVGDDEALAVVAAVLDAAAGDEPPRWWHRWVFRNGGAVDGGAPDQGGPGEGSG